MAYTLQKIGKSLVKYFKPVRVIPPHLPGEASQSSFPQPSSGNLDEEGRRLFRLLQTKKPGPEGEDQDDERLSQGPAALAAEDPEVKFSETAPSQWLELVLLLLSACKRATSRVKSRIAVDSYRKAIGNRGRTRIQTVGSIINTTADSFEDRNRETA